LLIECGSLYTDGSNHLAQCRQNEMITETTKRFKDLYYSTR